MNCPNCQQTMPDDSRFCDRCGSGLSQSQGAQPGATAYRLPPTLPQQSVVPGQATAVCPHCQAPARGSYCERCGTALDASRASAQQVGGQNGVSSPHVTPGLPPFARQAYTPPPRFILLPSNIHFPFPAGKQDVLIGREDPNQHLIPDINFESYGGADAGVSRRHARVYFDEGQWHLQRLSQLNKTFVNDISVQQGQSRPLPDRAIVLIGRLTLQFHT